MQELFIENFLTWIAELCELKLYRGRSVENIKKINKSYEKFSGK
jgi:hypothetical protein